MIVIDKISAAQSWAYSIYASYTENSGNSCVLGGFLSNIRINFETKWSHNT